LEVIMSLAAAVRQWHSRWVQARGLNALGKEQLHALSRDIGVPEYVLSDLVTSGPDAAAELPRLMDAISLDVTRIERTQTALMRDMTIICARCPVTARCRRHLDQGHARLLYRLYCPNADTLREL